MTNETRKTIDPTPHATEDMLRRAAQAHRDAGVLWDQWWRTGDDATQQEVLRIMEEDVVNVYRALGPAYDAMTAAALLEFDTAHFGIWEGYDFQSTLGQVLTLSEGKQERDWVYLTGRARSQLAEWLNSRGDSAAAAQQLLAALSTLQAEDRTEEERKLYIKVLKQAASNPLVLHMARNICAVAERQGGKTLAEVLRERRGRLAERKEEI